MKEAIAKKVLFIYTQMIDTGIHYKISKIITTCKKKTLSIKINIGHYFNTVELNEVYRVESIFNPYLSKLKYIK